MQLISMKKITEKDRVIYIFAGVDEEVIDNLDNLIKSAYGVDPKQHQQKNFTNTEPTRLSEKDEVEKEKNDVLKMAEKMSAETLQEIPDDGEIGQIIHTTQQIPIEEAVKDNQPEYIVSEVNSQLSESDFEGNILSIPSSDLTEIPQFYVGEEMDEPEIPPDNYMELFDPDRDITEGISVQEVNDEPEVGASAVIKAEKQETPSPGVVSSIESKFEEAGVSVTSILEATSSYWEAAKTNSAVKERAKYFEKLFYDKIVNTDNFTKISLQQCFGISAVVKSYLTDLIKNRGIKHNANAENLETEYKRVIKEVLSK